MNSWIDERTDERTDERSDGRIGGRAGGQVGGLTDKIKQTHSQYKTINLLQCSTILNKCCFSVTGN